MTSETTFSAQPTNADSLSDSGKQIVCRDVFGETGFQRAPLTPSTDTAGYNFVKIFDPPWGRHYSRAYSQQYERASQSNDFITLPRGR